MNITPLTIYLWQLADKVQGMFCAASIVLAIIIFLILFICTVEECTPPWKTLMTFTVGFVLSILAYLIVPSSNTVAMMVVIPKIAESKAVQQDLPDLYNAAVQALKDQLIKK